MNTDEAAQSVGPKESIFNRLLGVPAKQAFARLQQANESNEALRAEAETQVEQLRAENGKLTVERDHLNVDIAAKTETINAQLRELRTHHMRVLRLQDEIRKLETTVKQQSDSIRNETVSKERHNYEISQLRGEIQRLKEEVNKEKQYIERETVSKVRHNYEISQLKDKGRELTRSLELCSKAGKSVEAQRVELKILEDHKKAFCNELNAIATELGEKAVSTARPVQTITTLVAKVRGIRSSVDALEKQRTRIAAETEGLERKIDRNSARLLAVEDTLAKRKSACEERQRQAAELQTTSAQLRAEIKELESTFAARRRQLDEEYARDTAALADLKKSMMEEIDRSRKEQEASLPEARLRELETREQETRALHDKAAKEKKSAEGRLALAKEEAQQIRDQANKVLQKARTKSRDIAVEAKELMSAAMAKQRGITQKRRELASMPDKVEALSEANKRLKEIIARQKKDLQATGGKSELNQTIRELERDVRKLAQANEKLTEKLEKETERVHTLTLQGKVRRESVDGGFLSGYETAQEWMLSCGDSGRQHDWSRNIVMLGSGPFPDHLLDYELRKRKHLPCEPGVSNAEVMIVGRIGCSMNKIEQHIRCMEGGRLRIYSQEMAVLAMMTGADPFDADESVLMELGRSHPILAQLIEGIDYGWRWPLITGAEDEYFDEDQAIIHLPLEVDSPLAVMGYRVGKVRGLPVRERQGILRSAFGGKIPTAVSKIEKLSEYMEQWGRPKTSQRLWRMAKHLRGLISYNRKKPTWHHAIDDWDEDLLWMKKELYPLVSFKFRWPGTAE